MAASPAHIQLTEHEETVLREWTRKGTAERRLVDRARIILWSHEGLTVEKIAERLGTRPARVSKWRQRFVCAQGDRRAGRCAAFGQAKQVHGGNGEKGSGVARSGSARRLFPMEWQSVGRGTERC